jgi:XTP/dITP diphosphohydrolase
MLATQNRHKLLEFGLIMAPHEVVAMPESVELPPEGTESFAANSSVKARALREAVARLHGRAAGEASAVPAGRKGAAAGTASANDTADVTAPDFFIADDSGLEVEALGWGPGVISSRYAGREGDDRANIEKLLAALAAVRVEQGRRARFVCEIACLTPDGLEVDVRGEWWGRIAGTPLGAGGFGYDPVFLPDGSGLTVAQWPDGEKNRASHRARAASALLARLGEEGLLDERADVSRRSLS